MKNLEKEILEMIVCEMEIHNQVIMEDSSLTEEEKESISFDIIEVEENENVKTKCIEAMKKKLLKFALDYFWTSDNDKDRDTMYNMFDDVIDAYYDSI